MKYLVIEPCTFVQEIPILSLKQQKKLSTRTSTRASIDSKSSDYQPNPPPQTSLQAISSQAQKKNNGQIPPPPEFVITQPSPSLLSPSSNFTSEERSSE
ncbi:hypothetical protein O181_071072 [Austropuccinia psidii MF-1]|uniref:Uncharacterized protein n=1 Tax=Austropuccinia psidii MF-1 TaxID=1389203 RepID=A0A9Q3I8V7_9BASI|nr:hypothetical protein [Austropuccinia psidii MF-1]